MALSNYIEDDWGDNALSGRTNADKGLFLQTTQSGTGDALKGVYRPVWDITNGTPAAQNSRLEIPGGGSTDIDTVHTPAEMASRWEITNQPASTGDKGSCIFIIATKDAEVGKYGGCKNNGYQIREKKEDGQDSNFQMRNGGTTTILFTWNSLSDTNKHTHVATRDSYGNFEVLIDGSSKGATTDTTHTKASYTALSNSSDTEWYYQQYIVS